MSIRSIAFVLATVGLAGAFLFAFSDQPAAVVQKHWFVTPVAFLAAAVANATAIGGGFLFVPVFVFGLGLSASSALRLSIATQAFGMTSGAIGWSRDFIVWKVFWPACIGSLIGVFLGNRIWVPDNSAIKLAFGVVSVVIGIALIIEMKIGAAQQELGVQEVSLGHAIALVLLCIAGGTVTAWVSIGIGEVVALYLLIVFRIRMDRAVATGVAVLAACSIFGFLLYALDSRVPLSERLPWELLVFTAPGVIAGGRYGAKLGRWLEQRAAPQVDTTFEGDDSSQKTTAHSPLKWIFVVVVLLDGAVMLFQTIRA